MYHLVAKDKVPEQCIWEKSSRCNRFWVINNLLKVAKIAIACLILGQSQRDQKNIRQRQNSLGQLIEEKCVTAVVLEKSAWHTHARTHAHTHTRTGCNL